MSWTSLITPVAAVLVALGLVLIGSACVRAVDLFKRVYHGDGPEDRP